jgi:hypothetical protein
MISEAAHRLRETLAAARRARGGGPRKRAKPATAPRIRRSHCGPNGELREHPLIVGLHWLHAVGQALILSGVCFDSKVTYRAWEKDGCIGLQLQQVVQGRFGATGGLWENRRIPVEICNAQDTKALFRHLFEPSVADLIFASNDSIRLIHHGN